MKTLLTLAKATTIDGKRYRAGDSIELVETAARALVNSGVARRTDGKGADQRLTDSAGKDIRAMGITPAPSSATKSKRK